MKAVLYDARTLMMKYGFMASVEQLARALTGAECAALIPVVCQVFYDYQVSVRLCDITARTVLLYVLLCLTYMYCTLYILYILHTVYIAHVSLFPSFPCLSDVEASSSTSVHSCLFTHVHTLLSNHKCTFT